MIGEQPSKSMWSACANIKRVGFDSLVDALAAPGDDGAEGLLMRAPEPAPVPFSLGWRDAAKELFFVRLRPAQAEGGGGGGGPQPPSSKAMEDFCLAMSDGPAGAEPLEDWGNGDYVFAGDAWPKFKEIQPDHSVECLAGGCDDPRARGPVEPFPGVDGAAPANALVQTAAGAIPTRFVLTGTFPQYGTNEESPLQKGKAAVALLIKRFGGVVSTAISECVTVLARRGARSLAAHSCAPAKPPRSISPPLPPTPSPPLPHNPQLDGRAGGRRAARQEQVAYRL